MNFIFKWPKCDHDSMLPLTSDLFNRIKTIEYSEAIELINKNIPELPGEKRIEDEQETAKGKKSKKEAKDIFYSGSDLPFVNDHIDAGRNDPCPCGSGKKYKKCCFTNEK